MTEFLIGALAGIGLSVLMVAAGSWLLDRLARRAHRPLAELQAKGILKL
jgi:uncharacterized membrane protein